MRIKGSLAMVSAILSGCLLGSCVDDTLYLAEGGMTGTGISAGRITGFGSIYVNGVRYNVDQAAFYRGGTVASGQSDFHVGEFVTVTTSSASSSDSTTSVAAQVSFDSLITGEVTAISADGQSLEVMGQTVTTDELTMLHGMAQLTDLVLGNVVEVSGVRNAEGVITASSIKLAQATYPNDGSLLKLEGSVQDLLAEQQSFRLGNLTVDYSTAQLEGFLSRSLADGVYVEVETQQALQGLVLIASKVKLKSGKLDFPQNARIELEGAVTTIEANTDTSSRFTLNNQVIVTDANTQFVGMSAGDIVLDALLEAEGYINSLGELQASRVAARRPAPNDNHDQHLAGQITAMDYAAKTLVVQGSTLVVDNASMLLDGRDDQRQIVQVTRFEALSVGQYVEVKAILQNDGTLRVLRLDVGGNPRKR